MKKEYNNTRFFLVAVAVNVSIAFQNKKLKCTKWRSLFLTHTQLSLKNRSHIKPKEYSRFLFVPTGCLLLTTLIARFLFVAIVTIFFVSIVMCVMCMCCMAV